MNNDQKELSAHRSKQKKNPAIAGFFMLSQVNDIDPIPGIGVDLVKNKPVLSPGREQIEQQREYRKIAGLDVKRLKAGNGLYFRIRDIFTPHKADQTSFLQTFFKKYFAAWRRLGRS